MDESLNPYLRKKEITNKKYSEAELKSWICCLHNEIKCIKYYDRIKDGTIVYYSLRFKFPSEIGIGSKFYLREFVSTSLDKKVAELWDGENGKTILKIIILNNGTNGFPNYCCATEKFSPYPREKEVIITTHCSFIVTDIAHIDNKDYISLICEGFLFNLFDFFD